LNVRPSSGSSNPSAQSKGKFRRKSDCSVLLSVRIKLLCNFRNLLHRNSFKYAKLTMEVVPQSIQQTTFDLFYKRIKDQATCKAELVKTVVEILENPSLNTFSEFLNLPEISEVNGMSGGSLYFH
jgi:hypothetical protein